MQTAVHWCEFQFESDNKKIKNKNHIGCGNQIKCLGILMTKPSKVLLINMVCWL